MKTNIDYVRVTGVDELDQERTEQVRVKDENGRLMIDRIIKILSQNPKEHVSYDATLEREVISDYEKQLKRGLAITIACHDEQVTKEFFDAVYGTNRDAENPYLAFARGEVAAFTDAASGSDFTSKETIELKKASDKVMEGSDLFTLMNQALRARRRIHSFNRRYQAAVS